MSDLPRSTIHAALQYRDASAAIEWLCRVLGFEKRAVYENGQGGVAHAQLVFGNGMVMLSTAKPNPWDERMTLPKDIGGRVTHCPCLYVADADAHYAHAVAEGAEIVHPLKDQDYGGKGYSCRDPEGYLWWMGSYNPWAG